MSTLQLLISDLAARPDSSLLRLLSLRPELMDPPAADFAALAARASSRAGLSRALDRLNEPQLQLLTALTVTADPDTGATAGQLAKTVAGATAGDVQPLLAQLQELALVLQAPQDSDDPGPRLFLPVASLREVLGAHPAGLGRSYLDLADALPGCRDRLAGIVAGLGLPGAPTDPAAAVQARVLAFTEPEQLLAEAPDGTGELLARFIEGPMGRVAHALRDVAAAPETGLAAPLEDTAPQPPKVRRARTSTGAQAGPRDAGSTVNWLLRQGLLIPLDDDHVELPREVGLLLRHGHVVTNFAPSPPVMAVAHVRASLRNNAAMGAVAAVLRTMGQLLDSVEHSPLATLRAGGVGVRAVRTVAKDLGLEIAQTYFYLELAAMAKLITLDPDTSAWKSTSASWRPRDRSEQWLWLTSAWLDAGRLPSLVGTGSPAVNVLAGEAFRPDAPALRNTSLQVLASLHTNGMAGSGTSKLPSELVPAPAPQQVLEHYAWYHPRPARRISRALSGFLAEAEVLGLTGASALTDLGLAVIDRDWDGALALLADTLPEPVEHVLLQGDLTAVAPGYLSPALAAELSLLAEPEGRGAAGVYRFTPASIQRALAAGRTGAGIIDFLAAHSATPVPQPLEYLVADTASRHGRFTVGAASAVVSTADPALLSELLAGGAAARLKLTAVSPTVAVSTLPPAELARRMIDAGHSPELAGGVAANEQDQPAGRSRRPAPAAPHQPMAPYEATRLLEAEDQDAGDGVAHPVGPAAAQLAVLRSRPAWTPGRGEAAPALVREQLQRAIRGRADVWLTTVSSDGRPERLRLHPVTVVEGRVRAFDPERDSERIFSMHRIMDVELIDGTGTPTSNAMRGRP